MEIQSTATVTRRVTLPPLAWAALGVLAFSFTFPATVLAERGFDPYVVGAGRSVIAALIAAACLVTVRAPLPKRADLPGLLAVAVGCGIGFGLLSALALRHTTSTHAAVIVGLLPAATAIVAVLRTGERPRWPFWAASTTGTAAVVTYALSRGTGGLHTADLLLLAALAVGAVGYAEGGRLARTMPGWQVIAWGVLLALPVSLPFTVVALARTTADPTPAAVAGFAYVGVFSMFLGFFAWYRGLAEAGITRASQLQLAQPMLTIAWSVPLLGESIGAPALLTGVIVAACVLVTQRTRRTLKPDHTRTRPQPDPDSARA
jgi:drug/metabolite transporter (DMT)-like permease